MSQRLVAAMSSLLERRTTRRGFLARSAVVGSAIAVNPMGYVLKPGTAYAAVCGSDGGACSAGYTVMCCTINGGRNECPPGTFAGGWWKADNAGFCGGRARYYIDCQAECTGCGCGGGSFCSQGCWNCQPHCQGGATCDHRRVCWNVFRYGQCHQEIGCSGPVACRQVSCTPPYAIAALRCSTASATDNNTVTHTAPCLDAPAPPPDPIAAKYAAMGGARSVLGNPTSAELLCPDRAGKFRHYQHGSIYWTSHTGAHEVHGLIHDHWAALGWERGPMGYPTTDESRTPDGVGRFNHFNKGGSIYWTPATGAHEVHGLIRDKWQALGWERGDLGYPTTDETPTADNAGRYNRFSKGGAIYWSPATGAHEMHGRIYQRWQALGSPVALLGFPVTDEQVTGDRVGRYNHFAKDATILWHPSTDAHEVHGTIRDKYASLGWEKGALGYPISDQAAVGDGRGTFNDFAKNASTANGSIYHTSTTNAHEVRGRIRAAWLANGGPTGTIGYPTTDQYTVSGQATVAANDFEHATITYDSATDQVTIVPKP